MLDYNKLKPADILHVRGTKLFPSRAIRKMLKSWGNHDALVIAHNAGVEGRKPAPKGEA